MTTRRPVPQATVAMVRIDDLSFRIIQSPQPRGAIEPTVVLVHGIGMSHRYFSRLHRELSTRARVLSVDLPGFGGLPKPGRDIDIAQMATALAAALESACEGPLVLVGHSMGAQWVIDLAVQRLATVASVVVIGPVVDERHRSAMRQAVALGIDTLGESPKINAIVFSDYLRCGVPWYLSQLKHMLAYRTEQRIGELDVPVLIIRGGDDPVAGRPWCRALRDQAKNARLIEVPNSRHVAQHSAPRAVASAILSRLDIVPDASSERDFPSPHGDEKTVPRPVLGKPIETPSRLRWGLHRLRPCSARQSPT